MSKHHNYNNYTNYNKPQVASEPTPDAENVVATEDPQITLEELDEMAAAVADGTLQVEPEVTVEPEEEVAPPPAPLDGVVTAAKLNVRKLPSPNGEVVVVIAQNSKVQIDTEASTAEWYKVYTTAGVEGYCMKKFITVK